MESSTGCEKKLNKKPCIYILALGGTISSIVKQPTEEFYKHPSCNISDLLISLQLDEKKIAILHEQFLQKISHEMTYADLIRIAKKIQELVNDDSIDGIVITQGTNAIEEIAYFINLVVKTKKSIVFTGSYRPNKALGFDGDKNLYNAILLASSNKALSMGVLLTFNDYIISARYAAKLNPSVLGDFSSNNVGVLGFIQGNKILLQQTPNCKHTYLSEFNIPKLNYNPQIYVIYGHLAIDSIFVELAIKNNAIGIISAGMGKGYQPKAVTEALIEASKKGIIVVRCSRSGQGIVNRESDFDDLHGFIAGGCFSPQKARILLSVVMAKTKNKVLIQQVFDEY